MQVTPSKTFKYLLSLTRLSKGWMQASLLCVRLEDFCPEVVNCHKMDREGVLSGVLATLLTPLRKSC